MWGDTCIMARVMATAHGLYAVDRPARLCIPGFSSTCLQAPASDSALKSWNGSPRRKIPLHSCSLQYVERCPDDAINIYISWHFGSPRPQQVRLLLAPAATPARLSNTRAGPQSPQAATRANCPTAAHPDKNTLSTNAPPRWPPPPRPPSRSTASRPVGLAGRRQRATGSSTTTKASGWRCRRGGTMVDAGARRRFASTGTEGAPPPRWSMNAIANTGAIRSTRINLPALTTTSMHRRLCGRR